MNTAIRIRGDLTAHALSTGTSGTPGYLPNDYGPLVVRPVQRDSVAYQASTLLPTGAANVLLPIVATDATAGWYAENADITLSDGTVATLTVTPKKVAGLSKISLELANDSTPAVAQVIGDGIARDIITRIDAAYFGNTTANGPSGLLSLTPSVVDTGASVANLDPFVEAVSVAREVGAEITSWCMHPSREVALGKLKEDADSNKMLLTPDPTQPGRSTILGIPVRTSPAVDATTFAWGIPAAHSYVVQREGAEVQVDASVFFGSYAIGVRTVMRVAFGFPHPLGIVRLYDAS